MALILTLLGHISTGSIETRWEITSNRRLTLSFDITFEDRPAAGSGSPEPAIALPPTASRGYWTSFLRPDHRRDSLFSVFLQDEIELTHTSRAADIGDEAGAQ